MKKSDPARYIQNIVSGLTSPEKHFIRKAVKDGTEYMPKHIDIQIDWDDKLKALKQEIWI